MDQVQNMDKVERDGSPKFSLNENGRAILLALAQRHEEWREKNKEKEHETPGGKCGITPTSSNEKLDVSRRKKSKSRKHPALIANVPKETVFDELTQAKLELVQMQNELLKAEIIEKKKVWESEENERKKESEFKEKERKWKEAYVQKKTLFDEMTRANLESLQLQKELLEAEIIEKKKVWEFQENERKKESEFKEKERKWKEDEYKLKLEHNFE